MKQTLRVHEGEHQKASLLMSLNIYNQTRFSSVSYNNTASLNLYSGNKNKGIHNTYRNDNYPYLFTGKYTSQRITPGNVQEIFRIARKNAGFQKPVHPHTLRHSFATNLLRNNANIRYVQTLLGHSSLDTTMQYTHVVDEDLRKVYREHHTI